MSEAEALELPEAPDDLFTRVEMIEDLSSARTVDEVAVAAAQVAAGFVGIAREMGGEAKLTFTPEELRFRLPAPPSARLSLG